MRTRIAIACGSRDWGHPTKRDHPADRNALWEALDAESPDVLIEGGQVSEMRERWRLVGFRHGADYLARQWAEDRGVDLIEVPALWDARGKGAGPYRNRFQLRVAKSLIHYVAHVEGKPVDAVCIAAPLGGPGTRDMLRIVRDVDWRVRLVRGSRER
jgi:hypothetical protein